MFGTSAHACMQRRLGKRVFDQSRVETDLILRQITVLRESYRLASFEGGKMKYKLSIAATVVLALVTVVGIFYGISTAPQPGWLVGEGKKMFRLQEIEPSEPYLELADPLDEWTARAVQDTTQCVFVPEPRWNQCQIISSNASIFKYGEGFYSFTAGISASRPISFRADPERETGCGVTISLGKIMYSPEKPCYELRDPLDPWTEAALEDMINYVRIDDIYFDDCALLVRDALASRAQRPSFKYREDCYAIDLYRFYDGLPKRRAPVEKILIPAWLALGVVWLGSGVRNFVQEIRGRKT